MRLCIINEFFFPDSTGGTGTVLSELARNLVDNYQDVEIEAITSTNLYRRSVSRLSKYENWDGIQIHRIATPHPNGLPTLTRVAVNLLFTINALLKLLRLRKFDAIVIGTAPPMVALCASLYKAIFGTPFIYIVYDLEPDRSVTMRLFGKNHPFVKLYRRFQAYWLQDASRIVALGRCMRSYVSQEYQLSPSKIDVIPIGANEAEIVPADRLSRFRQKHKIDGFVVLYSGNFGRYHNFDSILDAAKILRSSSRNVIFVLVGGGAQKEHIVKRVSEESIDNVRVFDFVELGDYNDLLATADVSLVTLEPGMEGLCVPSKFYSILASGRPVIGMVGSISEVALVIEETHCGVQIDQANFEKLATVIERLSTSLPEREQMGTAARNALVEHYGTKIIVGQYYQTIAKACGLAENDTCRALTVDGEISSHQEAVAADLP